MVSPSILTSHPDKEAAETTFHPLVVDVKRHSLDDGPGIRSVVFFKGCPLRCSFCQNPEAQNPRVEIAFSAQRCKELGLCVAACPEGAVSMALAGRIQRDLCTRCGACADACPSGALRRIGTPYEPEELAEILLRDRHYYEQSQGGVTLSGGEPTLFPDYVEKLLRPLKAEHVHVILETCGYFRDYASFQAKILPYVDLVYFSLRLADPQAHRLHTGKSNAVIFNNLRRLVREPRVEVEVHIPLVPGVTDSRENLEALVAILRDAGVKTVQLLPYNPVGTLMAECLGRPLPEAPASFMKPQEIEQAQKMLCEIVQRPKGAAENPR